MSGITRRGYEARHDDEDESKERENAPSEHDP
jgi:hypothetical protein